MMKFFKSEQISFKDGQLVIICTICSDTFPYFNIDESDFICEETAELYNIQSPCCKDCYSDVIDDLKREKEQEDEAIDMIFMGNLDIDIL